MQISRTTIRLAQTYLEKGGFKPGAVDGVSGPKTGKALERALKTRGDKAPAAWKNWPRTRRLICFLQLTAKDHGIDPGPVDGIPGPVTNNAIDELKHFTEHGELPAPFRDVTPSNKNPNNWPKQTHSALAAFYGPHCKTSNFTRVNCPYNLRLAWDKSKTLTGFTCHKKVAISIERVLGKVLAHYGEDEIRRLRLDLFGGCYNCRKKRGGSTWSTHAWAIAIDFDPDHNRLRWGRDRATFARPEYDKWWQLWEAEGWVSLGRERNFDWMHVQAAKL